MSFLGRDDAARRASHKLTLRLGLGQFVAFGSTYYLPAALAGPMAASLGLTPAWIFGGLSLSLVIAGFMGPSVGRHVDAHGGRGPLALANILFAVGLVLLGLGRHMALFWAAWAVLGVGMGLGFYETAFAALARLNGVAARGQIAGVTLIAGLASTFFWPLSAAIEPRWGWEAVCFAFAAINLAIGLPLNLGVPRAERPAFPAAAAPAAAPAPQRPQRQRGAMLALGVMFAATSFVASGLSATLPNVLAHLDMSPAQAIFAASFVGPAQVAGRLLEIFWLRRRHPLLSARVASGFLPLAVAAFILAGPAAIAWSAPVFTVLFGVGNGLLTIARGALPLALFGAQGYGARMGLLVAPARFVGAVSPLLMGLLTDSIGAMALLLVTAALNVAGLVALLFVRK